MNINKIKQEINFKNLFERNITSISVKEENKFENFSFQHWSHYFDYLIPLKIYNPNTIKLLNYILNFKHYIWMNDHGLGGILAENDTGIVVNHANDYFILFSKQWPYSKNGSSQTVPSIQIVIDFIKGRLSSAIKEYLKLNSTIKIVQFKDLDNPDKTLTFERYYLEILYSFFKDNNLSKKFTEEQINEVIGHDLKNQFLLCSMEVFRQEIIKIEDEKEKSKNSLICERDILIEEIRKKYKNKINKSNKLYEDKIKDIQNQIQEFLKQN